MKRYILVLISLIIFPSCSPTSDDDVSYHFEYVPITDVEIPSSFTLDQTYEIKVNYALPSDCHQYYNHDYIYDNTTRIVGAIAIVNDDIVCAQATIDGEFTINIKVIQSETYIFRFWEGRDSQGIDQYLIIEVPVL